MKGTETTYACDKCGKKLKSDSGVRIVTQMSEDDCVVWSRLHVTIEHHHGVHNDGEKEEADLCKACTISLLEDALKNVRKGIRISAGVREIEEMRF